MCVRACVRVWVGGGYDWLQNKAKNDAHSALGRVATARNAVHATRPINHARMRQHDAAGDGALPAAARATVGATSVMPGGRGAAACGPGT